MSKKVNVYTLGQHGINRVKSPVHVLDGELLSAQNATVRPVQGQLAITKRDGMAKINASVAAGTILAIKNVPLDNPEALGNAWTSQSAGTTQDWNRVRWFSDLELFVAVGLSRCMTSPDGVTWTDQTITGGTWFDVAYSPSLGRLVACNDNTTGNNRFTTSDDGGVTWTPRTSDNARRFKSVVWSPELAIFVAGTASGAARFFTSSDGITWTENASSSLSQPHWEIAWSPELEQFVAVTSNSATSNQVAVSSNGTTWTTIDVDNDSDWRSVCWSSSHGKYVAVADGVVTGTQIMVSENGLAWEPVEAPNTDPWTAVTASSNIFCAVSTAGASPAAMTSPDGFTWTLQATPGSTTEWISVTWSTEEGVFVAVRSAGSSPEVMTSI